VEEDLLIEGAQELGVVLNVEQPPHTTARVWRAHMPCPLSVDKLLQLGKMAWGNSAASVCYFRQSARAAAQCIAAYIAYSRPALGA